MRAQPLRLIVILALLAAACGGDSDPSGPDDDTEASIIGTWKVLTSSGVDVSSLNGTYTVTATTIVENWPNICSKSYSYTRTGNRIDTTVTANNCNFGGSNEPVGHQGSANVSVNGDRLTVTVPSTGAVAVLEKI